MKTFLEICKAMPLGGLLFEFLAVVGFEHDMEVLPRECRMVSVMIVEFIDIAVLLFIITKFKFIDAAVFWSFFQVTSLHTMESSF